MSRFVRVADAGAAVAVLATVCAVPWIHGGTIPLARAVLLVGAVAAGSLSLAACLLRPRQTAFPTVAFPLGAIVAVGVIQLLPVHAPLVRQMVHAVQADLRHELPETSDEQLAVRTASAADTRLVTAQFMALMLLAAVAAEQFRSVRAAAAALVVCTANAVVLSTAALGQMFRSELLLIRSEWWTGDGHPFGTFVNPNNAAGWLGLGLACAVGLLILLVRERHVPMPLSVSGSSLRQRMLQSVVGLTGGQVAAAFAVVLIACAIVATRSRGAMLVCAAAFVIVFMARSDRRRLPGAAAAVVAAAVSVIGLMWFLNLSRIATVELGTLLNEPSGVSRRLQHWRDSLESVRDFPVFGTGLGAYRYATLPYQSRNGELWFRNADNQYVEFLVEAGIVGLLAFLMTGMPVLFQSIRVLRRAVSGGIDSGMESLAVVPAFAVLIQAGMALFDYGGALPAASSLFVILAAMFPSVVEERAGYQGERAAPGRLAKAGMLAALTIGTGTFVFDHLAAQRCYADAIQLVHIAQQPLSQELLDARRRLLQATQVHLEDRPDDLEAHETISRLKDDLLRSQFLRGLPGVTDAAVMERLWPATGSLAVRRRIDSLSDQPELQQHLRNVLAEQVRRSGIVEHCHRVILAAPLAAPVVRRAALWAGAARDPAAAGLVTRCRFLEPAGGRTVMQLAELALRDGRPEAAEALFRQALEAEAGLRGAILTAYSLAGQEDAGFSLFGPETYEDAVVAMREAGRSVLQRLAQIAADRWQEPDSAPSIRTQHLRAEHLQTVGRWEQRAAWLERCVQWNPDSVFFHTQLAVNHRQLGRLSQSLAEWREVLRLKPDDRSAQRGISELKRLLKDD